MFNISSDNLYHPKRNWILSVREHLNKSAGEEGLLRELHSSKLATLLSYPVPECSCQTSNSNEVLGSIFGKVVECPSWMEKGLKSSQDTIISQGESQEDDSELDLQLEPGDDISIPTKPPVEQDEEMDPDDK